MRIRLHAKKRLAFFRDYQSFKMMSRKGVNVFPFAKTYPCLHDKDEESGTASGHYFHQDLLVAQKVFFHNPIKHVDIGSRFDGFVAHVASFREIEVLDVRAQKSTTPNIVFTQADLMSDDTLLSDYSDSISCLHAIEHFGLGRYGDKLDSSGHIKGLDTIYRMLKKGGKFYFSVPIGPQRIEFNAHRVFSIQYLLDLFDGRYQVDSFSYVNDEGDLERDVALSPALISSNGSCQYGCGIFEMTKT